jgi:hypothetical protein
MLSMTRVPIKKPRCSELVKLYATNRMLVSKKDQVVKIYATFRMIVYI